MALPKREEVSLNPQTKKSKQKKKPTGNQRLPVGNSSSPLDYDRDRHQLQRQVDHHRQDLEDREVKRFGAKVDIMIRLVREFSSLGIVALLCVVAVQKPKEVSEFFVNKGLLVATVLGGSGGICYVWQRRKESQNTTDKGESLKSVPTEVIKSQEKMEIEIPTTRRNPFHEVEITKPRMPQEKQKPALPQAPQIPTSNTLDWNVDESSFEEPENLTSENLMDSDGDL